MRLVGLAAALAAAGAGLAAAGSPAQGQAQVLVRTPDAEPVAAATRLPPGELLLEIDVDGVAHSAADEVTLYVPLISTGGTSAEARRNVQSLAARVLAAARSAGVSEGDSRILPQTGTQMGFVGNQAMEAVIAAQSPQRTHGESVTLEIRLRDPSRFEPLRDALERAGAEDVPYPQYRLADEGPARRIAKADALRRAREEAEAYARALGMRVDHMLRVSERVSPNFGDVASIRAVYEAMSGTSRDRSDDVETHVRLSVDFALTARR